MIIAGKEMTLADLMVSVKHPPVPKPPVRKRPPASDFVWIAYGNTEARLPVAIAYSAWELAFIMGVSLSSVESSASKFLNGKIHNPKYAKVYIGDDL